MLRIQADTLREEMTQIDALVKALKDRVDVGIPGMDLPATDVDEEVFQVQFRGELLLASQRLLALAEVLE